MSETDLAKRVRPPTQLDRFAWEFFPPIAAIVLFGLLAFYNLRNIRLNEVDTETANHALGLIEQLQRDLLNAETGQRGYLLTGDLDYLEPYYWPMSVEERTSTCMALALTSCETRWKATCAVVRTTCTLMSGNSDSKSRPSACAVRSSEWAVYQVSSPSFFAAS